jgi:hypothetical protein
METQTTNDDKLIVMLDASAFKESACIRRLFFTTVLGYRGKINANDIEFGTAFHRFKAHWRLHGDDGLHEALTIAKEYYETTPMHVKYNKKYMTSDFLWNTCLGYYMKYREDNDLEKILDDDGKPLVEIKFAFPYYVDDVCEIIMTGTKDEFGKIKNGLYCIDDVKTSSASNISEYLEPYKLSPQLLFYNWAIVKYAEAHPESIYRKAVDYGICGRIDGVFLHGKDKPVEYIRSEVFRFNAKALREFDMLVSKRTMELVACIHDWKNNKTFPIREGMLNEACSTKFGPCKYFAACATPDDVTCDIILNSNFIRQPYNPLLFQ